MEEQFIYKNKYLKEEETILLKVIQNNDKNYVVIDKNIFYPQGGGQKGDRGKLIIGDATYEITNTIKNPNNISEAMLEIQEKLDENLVGNSVKVILDWNFRYQQMRLHSALHLVHYFLENLLGNIQYPTLSMINLDGTALNQYEDERITDEVALKVYLLLVKEVKKENSIETYPDKTKEGYRYWKYQDSIIPCGGTHVDNTKEIGKINYDYSCKKGHQTIKIILEN